MTRVTHFQRQRPRFAHSVERLYEDIRAHLPEDIQTRICINRFLSRGFYRRLFDIVRAMFFQGEVNHILGDVHYLTYFLNRRCTVLTILDCVTLERLRGSRKWIFWFFWYWLPEKRCSAIVVISEATRKQVLHYLNCDPNKVQVIYCNVSVEFKPAPKIFNKLRPRVLHIGTSNNKNMERHAEALTALNCELVIIGRLTDTQLHALNRYCICYVNYVNLTRAEMVEQYLSCDLVLFASTYEGFGLPIVEANAVGRPVVTSNIWSMPEVAGDAACLVDPYDVASIRAGIKRIIEDAAYRETLISNGFENVKRFDIDNIAAQYAALYRKIHARSAGDSSETT